LTRVVVDGHDLGNLRTDAIERVDQSWLELHDLGFALYVRTVHVTDEPLLTLVHPARKSLFVDHRE